MNLNHPRRILAVGAHPDDIEYACAGTLARCVQRGDSVTVAVVCRGDTASCGLSSEDLVAVRSREARDAAKVLGVELIEMGLPDYGVWPGTEILKAFTEVVRRATPDVIITHYHSDYGGDHNNTFQMVLDSTVAATVPNFPAEGAPIDGIPLLYMMEPLGGHGFLPDTYVDITGTLTVKQKMMECHRSQLEWMSRYGGLDSREYIETMARFRGYQCGVSYAEGFVGHRSWAHIPVGRVLP